MELDILAIVQEYAVIPVAGLCYLVGWLLKNIWRGFPNEFIPLTLLPVGLVGVLWLNGWAFTPQNIMAGICSAALAVYIHQDGKQLLAAKNSKTEAAASDAETGGE